MKAEAGFGAESDRGELKVEIGEKVKDDGRTRMMMLERQLYVVLRLLMLLISVVHD